MAVAEALIERDELVAEEIKQLIDEADAKRVSKVIMSDLEPLLGNGHSNGNGNGYALTGGYRNGGNGNGHGVDVPQVDAQPLPFSDGQTSSSYIPPTLDGPLFFTGG